MRRVDRVVVTVLFGRARDLSVVRVGPRLIEIILLPQALWARGFRESAEIDDAVMRILLARFGQVLGAAHAPRGEDSWSEAIEAARRSDGDLIWARRRRWAGWSVVGMVIAAMVTAALMGW